jgi:hypothetical protein
LLGGTALGGGIYLMGRWDALSGGGKAGAVVLVVLATMLILPALMYYIARTTGKFMIRNVTNQFDGSAERMMKFNKAMYGQPHEHRGAVEADFAGLDRAHYDSTSALLSERGFRPFGDFVDTTIESFAKKALPIRALCSADGTTQAAVYDVSRVQRSGGNTLICEFETEMSDGTFFLTSNAEMASLASVSPRIHRHFEASATPLELLQMHESEKQKLLAATPGVTCVACNTLAELLASQHRQQQAKNEFRKEIGYVDPDEVRRIAEHSGTDPQISENVADAVDELRRRKMEE